MDNFELIRTAIIAFTKKYNLKLVSDVNNDSNFEMIYINTTLRIEFIRDRGEFELYFKLLSYSDKLFNLNIFSKLLPTELSNHASHEDMLNYFDNNLGLIQQMFMKNLAGVLESYDKIFSQSRW